MFIGGSILCLKVHHVVGDGLAINEILTLWGALCRGEGNSECILQAVPHALDREQLRNLPAVKRFEPSILTLRAVMPALTILRFLGVKSIQDRKGFVVFNVSENDAN